MRKACSGLILGILFLFVSCAQKPVFQKAPEFTLNDLAGRPVHSSEFDGQVLLVNFWATWCPPCQAEIPALESLHKEYQSRGFRVLGISLDESGPADVKAFVERFGITYPVLMGDDAVVEAYGGIRGIPTTFLIARDGRIAKKFVGEQSKSDFSEAVEPLLAS
ncbi:MAG: TlpA family protein disulfide reductase [Candidatus Omnitrophica bacterium]|nr:TlpA family protein disulfide reductase [Candidatus Omnitrophota bacterium]